MAVVSICFLFIPLVNSDIIIPQDYRKSILENCVINILEKYFTYVKVVTFIDFDYNNTHEGILSDIHEKIYIPIIIRSACETKVLFKNHAYLIYVENVAYFIENFICIVRDPWWNAHARIIIVFKKIDENLRTVFDQLLKHHVIHVVVINAAKDSLMYSYNPFQDYGCGKRYDSLIEYGKCLEPVVKNFYPEKLLTGLRNCTFQVLAKSKWLPFTIDPKQYTDVVSLGVEQYVMNIIAELEHFRVNYSYTSVETYPKIFDNLTATGPLSLLQNNEVDMSLGGQLLTYTRAKTFEFLWGHLPYVDEMIVLVRRAQNIPDWKYMYVEFQPMVWILILITFIIFSAVMSYMFPVNDKMSVVIKMLDAMILHGVKFQSQLLKKCVALQWIWFAFIINTYYQTSLTSLTAHPIKEYQVSTEGDLDKFKFKQCTPVPLETILTPASLDKFLTHEVVFGGCETYDDSLLTVSRSQDLYAVTFSSFYRFQKPKFILTYGDGLFQFPKPVFKVIHGVLSYKGFQLLDKFQKHMHRLRENGLIDKKTNDIYAEKILKNIIPAERFQMKVLVPWTLFQVGCSISLFSFLLELAIYKKNNFRTIEHSQKRGIMKSEVYT